MDRRNLFVFNQVYRRKQVSLVVRRAEEMNDSWRTFVMNLIEADILKDLVLNLVMN